MTFHIGQKIASVKNADKVGVVLEIGEPNANDVLWLKIRFKGGKGYWTLADGVRPYQASKSIPVPDQVIVLVRPGHVPELFQQSGSTATQTELEEFLSAIHRMFLLHGNKTVV